MFRSEKQPVQKETGRSFYRRYTQWALPSHTKFKFRVGYPVLERKGILNGVPDCCSWISSARGKNQRQSTIPYAAHTSAGWRITRACKFYGRGSIVHKMRRLELPHIDPKKYAEKLHFCRKHGGHQPSGSSAQTSRGVTDVTSAWLAAWLASACLTSRPCRRPSSAT